MHQITLNPVLNGDLKGLVRISLPLMFFLFCEALTGFCERNFLSYSSLEAVHASLNASYLATIFQSPCVAIGAMAQVFVGLYQGSGEYKRIGPCVWQLVWFSFLSFLVTLPLSFLASLWFFKGTSIEKMGMQYFTVLAFSNFLFPLCAALSSFYLGRGKTALVTSLMLGSYILNLFLSWFLIFGIKGIISPLGAQGAALGKCISLGLLCFVFFCCFLTKRNRKTYHTQLWEFSYTALWKYMSPGIVRAFGYLSSKACWIVISYIVIKKGGKYLDVLTIGGTVISFLVFITNGIYKSILTIASNLIGAEKNAEKWKLCRTFIIYNLMTSALLTIPLLFFPNSLLYFFDTAAMEIFRQTFKEINLWIWFYMLALTMQTSFCALLIAQRDLKFQFYCYLFLWPISLLPVYLGIGQGHWQADKLWMIMIFENLAFMLFFFIRILQKKKEESTQLFSVNPKRNVPI